MMAKSNGGPLADVAASRAWYLRWLDLDCFSLGCCVGVGLGGKSTERDQEGIHSPAKNQRSAETSQPRLDIGAEFGHPEGNGVLSSSMHQYTIDETNSPTAPNRDDKDICTPTANATPQESYWPSGMSITPRATHQDFGVTPTPAMFRNRAAHDEKPDDASTDLKELTAVRLTFSPSAPLRQTLGYNSFVSTVETSATPPEDLLNVTYIISTSWEDADDSIDCDVVNETLIEGGDGDDEEEASNSLDGLTGGGCEACQPEVAGGLEEATPRKPNPRKTCSCMPDGEAGFDCREAFKSRRQLLRTGVKCH